MTSEVSSGAVAYRQCVNPDCLAEEGDRHEAACTPVRTPSCDDCGQTFDNDSSADLHRVMKGHAVTLGRVPSLTAEQIIAAALVQRPDPAEVVALLIDNGWTPPVEGRVFSPGDRHRWTPPSDPVKWEHCSVCGVIRRRDGGNDDRPCSGPVKVGLR